MPLPQRFFLDKLPTPIGVMLIVSDEQQRLRAVDWEDYESRSQMLLHRHYPEGFQLELGNNRAGFTNKLEAYMAGEIDAIADLTTQTAGSPFQERVWRELRQIKPGATRTYGQIAVAIGQPTASRAVGLANGANPIGVVVPCHRVIGANAALTGYGGGLHRKQWLLDHEARYATSEITGPLSPSDTQKHLFQL